MKRDENVVKEFKVGDYQGVQCPIIIYGAGIFGEYTLRALEQNNLCPACICDRAKAGKEYLGWKVCEPEQILQYENPIVLLAVGAAFQEVLNFLKEQGVKDIYSVYDFIFEDTVLELNNASLGGWNVEYYKKVYLFGMKYGKNIKQLNVFSLDWVITEKCSMRCKECSNLMQYYQKPQNIPVEKLKKDMKRVLSFVDEIMDIRIIGGEPFMHPEMGEILESFLDCEQIHNFSIYTNATILPNKKILQLMKHRKVKCEITDYGELAPNYPAFVQMAEREGIRYRVIKNVEWHKLGGLYHRNISEEEMKEVFAKCYCNDLITLLDGKIYRCPYSAHGRVLEAIPYKEEDVVDIYVGSREYLKSKLHFLLFEKKFDYACGYCDGRNQHLQTVKPAEQIKQPLPYKKYYE